MTNFEPQKEIKDFYNKIITTNYENISAFKILSEKITNYISNNPDDIYAYILLNQCIINQGLSINAKLITEKIWSIGRKIDIDFEKLYFNQLIDLGFNQYTYSMCKSKINNHEFSELIYKASIQIAETFLTRKVMPFIPNRKDLLTCNSFINYINDNKFEYIYKDAMNLITNETKEVKSKIDFEFYNINEKPSLNIKIFINENLFTNVDIKEKLDLFFAKKETDKFINLSVLNIKDYQ